MSKNNTIKSIHSTNFQNILGIWKNLKIIKYSGFTMVELLVVMTIFVTLVGIASINLVGAKQRTSLNTSADILIGDFRQQQMKAMIGDTEGRATADKYGVHFGTDSYTLFNGSTYNAADTNNFEVKLGDNITFSSVPTDVIFDRVSGETGSANTIVLIDNTTNTQKTIQYNRYGVVTDVN